MGWSNVCGTAKLSMLLHLRQRALTQAGFGEAETPGHRSPSQEKRMGQMAALRTRTRQLEVGE